MCVRVCYKLLELFRVQYELYSNRAVNFVVYMCPLYIADDAGKIEL
jgi:hypothetical protein